MCDSNSTPYGLNSLVECMSRATLLAHPDDVPGFLSTHAQKILQSCDGRSNDTAEVAFLYQEQWEKSFLQEECKQTDVLKPSTEDPPSPASGISGEFSYNQEKSLSPTAQEECFPSRKPGKVPPVLHGHRVSSARVLPEMKTNPSLPSAIPVPPPVPLRAPLKKTRGQMLTKRHDSVYTCPLADCPYHNKREDRSLAKGSGSVGINTGSDMYINLGLQKGNAKQRSFQTVIPYRPKGGYIVDPELVPKRGRAAMSGRQAFNVVLENTICTNVSQVPPETSLRARLHMIHNPNIIRYKGMHARCSKLQPHSGGWHNISSQPGNELQQAGHRRQQETLQL